MARHLFCFGFEPPVLRRNNDRYGTDHEDSEALFIEAPTEEEALAWGQEVAEAFQAHLFEQDAGWQGDVPSWREDGYAFFLETDPIVLAQAEGSCPIVQVGQMPAFSADSIR